MMFRGLTRIGLGFVYENMARFLQRSRRFLATSAFVLLAGVVVLSAATRRPCLHVHSGPWHTFKAGHMAAPELHKLGQVRTMGQAQVCTGLAVASPLRVSISLPHQEAIPPALSIVDQIYRFRSPPPSA